MKYLKSVIADNSNVHRYIAIQTAIGCMKMKEVKEVLYDRKMTPWFDKTQVVGMRMFRFAPGVTRLDSVINYYIRGNLGIFDIGKKIEEDKLNWLL